MVPEVVRIAIFGLAVLALVAILASLAEAWRFRRKVKESLRWSWTAFSPNVLVLVPCRGADPQLEGNLAALLDQEGVVYRVVIVIDSETDPAVGPIRAAIAAHPRTTAKVVIATLRAGYSGKAAALLRGLEERTREDEVIAFADADIRPPSRWLRTLVQPLADPAVAISTGYRWYVPVGRGMASAVRATWNAVGLNIFFSERYNFAWGGANAIRADTLDAIGPASRWRGTLSEDLAVTDAAKAMGRKVAFVASAMAPTFEDCSWSELIAWSTRQTAMVAVWGRHIGRYAAITAAVYNGITALGVIALCLGLLVDPILLVPAGMFLLNLPASVAKNAHRSASVFLANAELRSTWRVPALRFAVASLIVPWLIAYNLARAARLREVEWRGRTYRVAGGVIVTDDPES